MKPKKKKNKRSIPYPPSRLDNIRGNGGAYRSKPQLEAEILQLAKVVSIQDRTIKYWADILGYDIGDGVRLMRRRAQEKDYELSPLEERRHNYHMALFRLAQAEHKIYIASAWWKRIFCYKEFNEARNEWAAAKQEAAGVLAVKGLGLSKGMTI